MIRRLGPTIALAVGLTWVAVVALLIARTPEAGATDPAALAAAYQSAIDENNAGAVERLLADSSPGTAARLLAGSSCRGRRVEVEATGDHLTLRGPDGVTCTELAIVQRGGRWYVDAP